MELGVWLVEGVSRATVGIGKTRSSRVDGGVGARAPCTSWD